METQNVTLSLPKELLLKAKLIAVRRGTSLSALLARSLKGIVERDDAYLCAKERHLELLERGMNLGTLGKRPTTREELHERD